MGIGKRIREAREMRGYTQKELADKLGVTSSAIANYENNVSHPKEPVLYSLLSVLGVDANFLFQDEMRDIYTESVSLDEMENIVKKYRRLDPYSQKIVRSLIDMELNRSSLSAAKTTSRENNDIIENCIYLQLSEQPASAGSGVYLGPEAFRSIKVVENQKTRRAAFCVRVSGDSMEPLYADGDIVMVSRDSVQLGDIALVTLNGNGYIKRLGNGCLISENKKYNSIPCPEGAIVNGCVIGVLQPEWIIEM